MKCGRGTHEVGIASNTTYIINRLKMKSPSPQNRRPDGSGMPTQPSGTTEQAPKVSITHVSTHRSLKSSAECLFVREKSPATTTKYRISIHDETTKSKTKIYMGRSTPVVILRVHGQWATPFSSGRLVDVSHTAPGTPNKTAVHVHDARAPTEATCP